jgi:uncharacterized membrane protein
VNSRSKATFLVLLIFGIGVLFGGTLVFFWAQPRFPFPEGWSPGRRQEIRNNPSPGRGMSYLSDALDLSPSQQTELRRILEESRQQLGEINKESNRRHRGVRRETLEQIRTILEPDQMERFEEFLAQREQRGERRRQGPGSMRRRERPRDNPQ